MLQVDGPGDLLADVPLDDPRISHDRSPRTLGPAISRTIALTRARGEIVRVLDADDVLPPGQLAREIAVFGAHPEVAWVTSAAVDLLPDVSTRTFENPPAGLVGRGEVVAHWRRHDHTLPVHPASLSVRVGACRAVGGWMALPASEDTGLLLVLNALFDGYFLSEVGLGYRKWGEQMTAQDEHADAEARAVRIAAIEQRLAALDFGTGTGDDATAS